MLKNLTKAPDTPLAPWAASSALGPAPREGLWAGTHRVTTGREYPRPSRHDSTPPGLSLHPQAPRWRPRQRGWRRIHPEPPPYASSCPAGKGAQWPPRALNSAGNLARGARADGREGRRDGGRRHVESGSGGARPGAVPSRAEPSPALPFPAVPVSNGGAGTRGRATAAVGA